MADFFEIDFLDVETKSSGDAICLRYEISGQVYIHVVDGGYLSTGTKLVDHIREHYNSPSYIDNVVSTHNDGDHARGLATVLENFSIGALWMLRPWIYAPELLSRFSRYTNANNLASALREAYPNLAALEDIAIRKRIPIYDPFQGAEIGAFRVMAPTRARYLELIVTSDKTPNEAVGRSLEEAIISVFQKAASVVNLIRAAWGAEAFPADDTSNENEMSVVQYARLCGEGVLLTADTGRDGLQEVIDYAPYIGLSLPGIDRFQVPHHGGRHNVTSELLNAIVGPPLQSPPAQTHFRAYISSAADDDDHPRKVVVRAMIHRGASVVTTEGKSIQAHKNAPARNGWSAVAPVAYPDDYET